MTAELTRDEVVETLHERISAADRGGRSAREGPARWFARARSAVRNRTGHHPASRRIPHAGLGRRGPRLAPADGRALQRRVLHAAGRARARAGCAGRLVRSAPRCARERPAGIGGRDRRGLLRTAAAGSGRVATPADPGRQRARLLHRRGGARVGRRSGVRDAARHAGRDAPRARARLHRDDQSARGLYALQLARQERRSRNAGAARRERRPAAARAADDRAALRPPVAP